MITPAKEEELIFLPDPQPNKCFAKTRAEKDYGNIEKKEKEDPDPIDDMKDRNRTVTFKDKTSRINLLKISGQKSYIHLLNSKKP